MNTIYIFANHVLTLSQFRTELIRRLADAGYNVTLSFPLDTEVHPFGDFAVIDTSVDRWGINPVRDIGLFFNYLSLLRRNRPGVALTYTVKPNIYAALACRFLRIPCISNLTGLGIMENKGFLQKLLFSMQKAALKRNACVFFQNEDNYRLYLDKRIVTSRARLIPGSGVNLEKFSPAAYPPDSGIVKFLTVARVRKDKGFDELFAAIRAIDSAEFHIVGGSEDNGLLKEIEDLQRARSVIYHDQVTQEEVRNIVGECHCLIHPSHSEGMANVILEGAATARPVIASDIPGCREAVEDGVTGYLFPRGEADKLTEQIKQFLTLTWEQRREMGLAGRAKMEREFDRNIVVDAYMQEIERCLELKA